MLSYLRKILRSISTRIIIGGDFSNDLFGVPLKELSSKNAEKVFDKGVLRLFKTAVPLENADMLGHWLDCEAHYDVLRELYKTYNHTNELD